MRSLIAVLLFVGLSANGVFAQPADAPTAEPATPTAEPATPTAEPATPTAEPATPTAELPKGEPGPPPAVPETRVEVEKAPAPVISPADDAYQVKVTALEQRVNELKEKIFRSKARLANLKGTVLSSSVAGAEAQIIHRNEMGSSFQLEKITYSLDGTPVRSLVDEDGSLDSQEELEILDGPIVPGNHTISVVMVYRGNGFGIFSYLRGYVFNLRSSHTFHADEGKLIRVKVVGYEKGGMTTDLKERPDIRFEDQLLDARRDPKAASVRPSDG